MRPPICAVCDDDLDASSGGLVTFVERDSDREWRERMAASSMVGHPPNVEWFCARHAEAAAALASSTIDVALRMLLPSVEDRRGGAPRADQRPADGTSQPEIVRVSIPAREIDDVHGLFRGRMPALVGDPDAVAVTSTERTWSPMDGSSPPNCPFDDVDTTTMTGPLGSARLEWDRAMWNDDDAARRTARLVVEPVIGQRCSVSATVGAGFAGSEGSRAREVLVLGEPSAPRQALLDELLA